MTRRAHLIGHTTAALEQPRAAGKPPDTTADHRQWPSRPKAPTFDSPPEPHISPGDASKEVTAQHVDVAQSRDFGLSSGRWVGGGKRGRSVASKEEPGTRGRRQRRAGPASLGFPLTQTIHQHPKPKAGGGATNSRSGRGRGAGAHTTDLDAEDRAAVDARRRLTSREVEDQHQSRPP
jgi:hypothetical protein